MITVSTETNYEVCDTRVLSWLVYFGFLVYLEVGVILANIHILRS